MLRLIFILILLCSSLSLAGASEGQVTHADLESAVSKTLWSALLSGLLLAERIFALFTRSKAAEKHQVDMSHYATKEDVAKDVASLATRADLSAVEARLNGRIDRAVDEMGRATTNLRQATDKLVEQTMILQHSMGYIQGSLEKKDA